MGRISSDVGKRVNFGLLSANDEAEHPAARNLDGFVEDFAVVEVNGSYSDVRGKAYKLGQTVDVRSQWEEAKKANRLRAFRGPLLPIYQLVRDMRDELRAMKRLAQKADRRANG